MARVTETKKGEVQEETVSHFVYRRDGEWGKGQRQWYTQEQETHYDDGYVRHETLQWMEGFTIYKDLEIGQQDASSVTVWLGEKRFEDGDYCLIQFDVGPNYFEWIICPEFPDFLDLYPKLRSLTFDAWESDTKREIDQHLFDLHGQSRIKGGYGCPLCFQEHLAHVQSGDEDYEPGGNQ